MLELTSQVEIIHKNQLVKFKHVHEARVATSIETLTDTCTVILPRKTCYADKEITEYIERGDKITIRL